MGLNTILNLLAQYHIDANELLLLYLTFIARDEEGHSEYFTKWYNNGGHEILKTLFNSLKDKGIIHKNYNPVTYEPNAIEFSKKFIKSWNKCSGKMGQELFNLYPAWVSINGKMASLKDVSKKFDSLENFFFFYSVQIGHDPVKHEEILDILKWAKENNYINFGILSFVISHKWNDLKELRDNPNIINTVDSILSYD